MDKATAEAAVNREIALATSQEELVLAAKKRALLNGADTVEGSEK